MTEGEGHTLWVGRVLSIYPTLVALGLCLPTREMQLSSALQLSLTEPLLQPSASSLTNHKERQNGVRIVVSLAPNTNPNIPWRPGESHTDPMQSAAPKRMT